MLRQGTHWLLVILSLAVGGLISLQHPLGVPIVFVCFAGAAAVAFWRPTIFLTALPALTPVIGLAPWSGWLTFEELDLVVLAFAAGGYARWGMSSSLLEGWRWPKPVLLLVILMSCALLISTVRGLFDAGGFVFGLDQGYDGPMNSLRIAKSFFLALLVTPLLAWLAETPEDETATKLALGLALGLGFASLAALWERLAFTGLLNFSSDYRSTALFWEMHVGGAAHDGWLLLTTPFAVWTLRNAAKPGTNAAAVALTFLAGYAALTTFSRATYLALAIMIPFLIWRLDMQGSKRLRTGSDGVPWGTKQWLIVMIFLGLMIAPMFSGGGYRGVIALLGLTFVGLSLPSSFQALTFARKVAGITCGLVVGTVLIIVSNFFPKGPYLLHAGLLAISAAIFFRKWRSPANSDIAWQLTVTFCAMLPTTLNVAGHWGGVEAIPGALLALTILAIPLVAALVIKHPLWPTSIVEHARLVAVGAATAGLVAAILGGPYIGERFSTTDTDLQGRFRHWQQSLAMLQTPGDYLFGKGLGRFPANNFFASPDNAYPGSYRIGFEGGNGLLSLRGGNYSISFGDILRVTQRIDRGYIGPFHIKLRVRARTDAVLYLEVCDRHLLYPKNCLIQHVPLKADPDSWQTLELEMEGEFSGPAKTFRAFAIGLLSQRGAVDVDDIVLATTTTDNLLSNGDFSQGGNRWFVTSDRNHLPWHAKSLTVNLLFDQGAIGFGLFLLLSTAAFWRTAFGGAREHPLAPYVAASLLGFWVVGVFDSLIDAPRVAFLYFLICLYSFTLGGAKQATAQPRKR